MKNHSLKKTLTQCFAAVLLCGFVSSVTAQTPLPIYEPFPASYTNGTVDETVQVPAGGTSYPAKRLSNGTSGTLWSIGGAAGGGSVVIVGGTDLSYPGLFQTPGTVGLFIRTNNTTATRSRAILFPTNSSGSVYASALINVQQAAEAASQYGRLFVKLDAASSGNGSTSMGGVWLTSSNTLAISKSSNAAWALDTTTPLSAGTHLVVLRYTFNAGVDDDEVALWIDPAFGSFNVPEVNVPTPTLSVVTGTDAPSLSSFYIYHIGTEVVASMFLDEIRLANVWASVTSTQALCTAASIATPPANQTVFEGLSATLSVTVGGSSPTFQWQLSTNGGTTWNSVAGATAQSYLTPVLVLSNNGDKYRVIANVACNSSSATSSVATITVTPAVVTPNGVILDDVFADAQYNNIPVAISNSVWLQSVASTLDASSGTHLLATSQASSANWIGFFTDDSVTNQPVHLAVGKTLKATMVFKGNNIVTNNGNFRIGLFDYADGGTRPVIDGAGVANSGVNVRGYMVALNYGTNFTGNPYALYARNTLVADLMGTTANYLGLGGGPTGYTGAPAFQSGVPYTAVFSVARTAVNSSTFTVTITGGGTNWTHSRVDTNYAYARFDAIGIRSASAASAADSFEISRLLVEVVSGAPSPAPLNIASSGSNVTLTWTNSAFSLQAAPNATGTYTNVPGATSPHVTPAGGSAKYFRLIWP